MCVRAHTLTPTLLVMRIKQTSWRQSDQIPPDCSRSDSSSCLISGRFRKSIRALDHGGGESNSKEHKYASRCWLSIGHEVAKWEGVSSSSSQRRQDASSW